MKFLYKFLIGYSALALSAQENLALSSLPSSERQEIQVVFDPKPKPERVNSSKVIPFASLSLASGGGVSYRTRENGKGRALDFKLGYIKEHYSFFFSTKMAFVPMIDYNFIYYGLGVNENAPYLSWGLGAFADFQNSIGLPYIPVRAGYEFKYGFIDLGAKLLLGIFPAPELRAGVGFCF